MKPAGEVVLVESSGASALSGLVMIGAWVGLGYWLGSRKKSSR